MTRALLVYRDLVHGGTLDPDGIMCLFCVLFCIAAMACLAVSIWRTEREQSRADEQVRRQP